MSCPGPSQKFGDYHQRYVQPLPGSTATAWLGTIATARRACHPSAGRPCAHGPNTLTLLLWVLFRYYDVRRITCRTSTFSLSLIHTASLDSTSREMLMPAPSGYSSRSASSSSLLSSISSYFSLSHAMNKSGHFDLGVMSKYLFLVPTFGMTTRGSLKA